jgi:hypothetical protein
MHTLVGIGDVDMDHELLCSRLQEAAEGLGVEVRHSPSESEGAVVKLRGKTVVFLPSGALPAKKVEILARALSDLVTDDVFLVSDVRAAIEKARRHVR